MNSSFKISLLACIACMFMFSPIDVFAQTRKTVKGKVFDSDGNPLIGVAVYDSKEKSKGSVTDDSGTFSINIRTECKNLVFACLGYVERVIPISEVKEVVLQEDAIAIESTVVVGIYERKKESFTGAVQTINSDNLIKVGNQNVVQSLKNIDPSLMIFDNLEQGSNPNAMASMQLRGASSLMSETSTSLKSNFVSDVNMPLFILDGFETSIEKIQDMDMNRIESITILKDASAKAIYGSKGGNGVIVIETKAMRSEQTLVSYIGSLELELPDLSSYNLCNSLEKLEIEKRENYYTIVARPVATTDLVHYMELYNRRYKQALEGEDTYWLSKPVRTGVSHKHAINIELGTKELRAVAGFSYSDNQGVMKGSYRNVFGGDISLSYRKGSWVFRNVTSVHNMKSEESPYGSFHQFTVLNPYENPYDENGNLKSFLYDARENTRLGNPLYDAQLNTKFASSYLNVTNNLYIEYRVKDFVKIVGRMGIDNKNTASEDFYPSSHSKFLTYVNDEDTIMRKGSMTVSNGLYTSLSGDVSAQFNKTFAKKHDIFATAQYSISQTKYKEVAHYVEGFPSSHSNNIIFARQYAQDSKPTGTDGLNRNLGLLLTTGYSYANRYMLDATIKGSASSVFGTDNRWGTFWSAGLAWNVHNEEFLKKYRWVQQLKLRASLGSSGNQNYSTNNSLPIYQYYNDRYYNGFAGAYLQNMSNPHLGWEQKMDYNIGVDFKSKYFNITADAYVADTENMIFTRSILPSTGFKAVSDNLGKVRNKGIELGGSLFAYQRGTSYVSLFAKIAFNDNKILKISDALKEFNKRQIEMANDTNSDSPVIQYYDGAPLHSIWAVPSLGIDPISGNEIFLDKNGNMTNEWQASNMVNCGSSDPLYNGNFGISGEISGFGFNVVCTFYGGGYKYNSTLVSKVENVSLEGNVDRRILAGRWYTEGQEAIFRDGFQLPTRPTTRFVQKNNTMSLSSVSLYYDFPLELIKPLKLSRLKLALYGNDLFTLSTIEIERGTYYPYARSFTFSLTATF